MASALFAIFIVSAGSMPMHSQQAPSPAPNASAVPLPERNPARLAPPPHPGQLAAPEWTAQDIQDAIDRCAMMLAGTGAVYRSIDPISEGQCGAPAPVELSAIGSIPSVAIDPPARVTCGMAASLDAWADSYLQFAARMHLDTEITGIRNVASYVCRNRYNSTDKPISEHARANALDMAAFKTKSGEWITVLDNWAMPPVPPAVAESDEDSSHNPVVQATSKLPGETDPAPAPGVSTEQQQQAPQSSQPEPKPQTSFLREIHAGGCALFGTVLGPEANEAHKNHFHFDLAERRHSNFCE